MYFLFIITLVRNQRLATDTVFSLAIDLVTREEDDFAQRNRDS
jgi:hypothetical protein